MSYYRSSSPGRRAIYEQGYGRSSDAGLPRDSYALPRDSTERIIPVAARDTRGSDRSREPRTRPRRSTLDNAVRPSSVVVNPTSKGKTPAGNPSSSPALREGDEPPKSGTKMLYAIGGSQTHLVQSIDSPSRRGHTRELSTDKKRTSRRRSSRDAEGYPTTGGGKGGKEYHLTGPTSREPTSMYSYTDPRAMYEETEPVWRSRKGSADGSRSARPQSMMFDAGPRSSQRDLGPPTSRALDRLNDSIARSNSTRYAHRPSYDDTGYNSSDDFRSPRRTSTLPENFSADYDYNTPASRSAHHSSRPITVVHERRPGHGDYYSVPSAASREALGPSSYDSRYASEYKIDDRRDSRTLDRQAERDYKDTELERRGFGIMPVAPDRVGAKDVYDDYDRMPPLPPAGMTHASTGYSRRPPADLDYLYSDEPEPLDRSRRDETSDRDRRRRRDHDREDRRDDYDDYSDASYTGETRRGRAEKEANREPPSHTRDRERVKAREEERLQERSSFREADRDRERDRDRDPRRDDSRRERGSKDSELANLLPAAMIGAAGTAALAPTASAVHNANGASSKRSKRNDLEDTHDLSEDDDDDSIEGRDHVDKRSHRSLEPVRDSRPTEKSRPYPEDDHIPDSVAPAEPRPRPAPALAGATIPAGDEEFLRRLEQARQEQAQADRRPSKEGTYANEREVRPAPIHEGPSSSRHAEGLPISRELRHAPSDESQDGMRRSDRRAIEDERLVSSASSEGMNDGERKQRVRIVEPPAEAEIKPRGILKKPKEQFPEHPNPIREGVAPLKDKKLSHNIPPNARWTKVNRRIVNAEALETLGERFEERQDCLIVLRVLDDADVQKMADLTAYIRQQREVKDRRHEKDEAREARRRARRDNDEYEDDASDSDELYGERKKPPRMLEGAAPSSSATMSSATASKREQI